MDVAQALRSRRPGTSNAHGVRSAAPLGQYPAFSNRATERMRLCVGHWRLSGSDCFTLWFMLTSPSSWFTKGFRRSSPRVCGSGEQKVHYHFCHSLGRAHGIRARLCLGFKASTDRNGSNSIYYWAWIENWCLSNLPSEQMLFYVTSSMKLGKLYGVHGASLDL